MTDENQIEEDQEVELHDEVEDEVVEEAHDPKNAEAQSVASVDSAENAGKSAKKRKGDKTVKDAPAKMPGTKAGMINQAYNHMAAMKKEDLAVALRKLMSESADEDGEVVDDQVDLNYQTDFSDDLNALIADEATLSEEFKDKAGVIFEAAIKSKLTDEINRLEEKYNEELEAEINSTKEGIVEKVDSYLNYVVEQWMEDNKVAIQTGLRTEIAETFMNGMKDLFAESYIDVPDSKTDLVDELAETCDELEVKLNDATAKAIEMSEELEHLKRDAIINEASRDLAESQIDKLKSLVEDVDFDDEETFIKKVLTVKESYFNKKTASADALDLESQEEDGDTVEVSGSMAQYISALKTQIKN